MYIGVGDRTGVDAPALSGTIQNDILKEYQAQKEYVFPPRPSVRLVADLIRFATAELPRWHPVSISGYHIREAGSTAAQELAFTLANGFAYVEAALGRRPRGRPVRARGSASSSTPTSTSSRRSPSTGPPGGSGPAGCGTATGPTDPRSLQLRFHTQTAGVSLTAQQPEVNLARVAIEALAGVLGGTQSLHTDAYDEALALPTDKAARLALRTQQVIAEETGVVHVADPLGGSWFVESLTDELERRAEEVFAHLDGLGRGSMLEGVIACIDDGWFCREIADAAYEFQSKIAAGRWVHVGVNGYTDGDDGQPPTLYIDPAVEARPARRAGRGEAGPRRRRGPGLARSGSGPRRPTPRSTSCRRSSRRRPGTSPSGESMGALEDVFGTWIERSFV